MKHKNQIKKKPTAQRQKRQERLALNGRKPEREMVIRKAGERHKTRATLTL